MTIDPVIGHAVALGLALLFAIAVVHKAADPKRFGATVAAYRLLPPRSVTYAATLIALAEALCAASLILGATRPLGAALAAALLSLYALALEVNIRRGRNTIDCGCVGGGARRGISRAMPLRNLLLAAAAPIAAATPSGRELTHLDALTVAGVVAAAAALYATIGQLSTNRARSVTGAHT